MLWSEQSKLPYPYEYEKSDVEKRIIMRTLITINGVQIAFYNTHLSYEEVKLDNGISFKVIFRDLSDSVTIPKALQMQRKISNRLFFILML